MVPWLHWWFVPVDSSNVPKWTKNSRDPHESWEFDESPLKSDGTTKWFIVGTDKVKFVGKD